MKKQQQAIECGRCGETRMESLTEEEAGELRDATGPIYRQCARCEKTTGWISSARPSAAAKDPMLCQTPRQIQNQSTNKRAADNQAPKGQERMATQAERDSVNSLVLDGTQRV